MVMGVDVRATQLRVAHIVFPRRRADALRAAVRQLQAVSPATRMRNTLLGEIAFFRFGRCMHSAFGCCNNTETLRSGKKCVLVSRD